MTFDNSSWCFEDDLNHILDKSLPIFKKLQGANIFMTGGTGFIGCWLLESIKHANTHLKTQIKVTVLTRNVDHFKKKALHLAQDKDFNFIVGDIFDFEDSDNTYTHIIHAATDASAELNERDPARMFNTIVEGTRRILDFAARKKPQRILFLSSGAVYGQQPFDLENVPESWLGGPNYLDPKSAYAEGKRAAEMLCAIYGKQYNLNISIARIFALLGPYLSLDIHFAAGNFIRNAMAGKKIIVNGNGMPCRSYLYASDLTIWLLHLLELGTPNKPYNVGSDESISIKALAELTSNILHGGGVEILGAADPGWNLGRYVPDVELIKKDLGLKREVSLEDAILRTAIWNRQRKGSH